MGLQHDARLMTKVARLYHEMGLTQPKIASRLHLSQSSVSRLLRRAQRENIVRISVTPPRGTHTDLEEALQETYGLQEAVVVDSPEAGDPLIRELGAAAAYYLESTTGTGAVIGLSSWSAALLAMVAAIHPVRTVSGTRVVQFTGGVGNPATEGLGGQLTRRLSELIHGDPVFLPAPGIADSLESKSVLMRSDYVVEALHQIDDVTVAFVGIGGIVSTSLRPASARRFAPGEFEEVTDAGAVGDICLRYFDAHGRAIASSVDDRIIGIELDQLRRIPRTVGVAGGVEKLAAIRGALRGRLINVLVTDARTAESLLLPPSDGDENRSATSRPLRT